MKCKTMEEYLKLDASQIASPDWKRFNVKSKETVKIPFSQIYVDNITMNHVTKEIPHDSNDLLVLEQSFRKGIFTDEDPPAVIARQGNHDKPWVLAYGFGRFGILKELAESEGLRETWFTVLEGDQPDLHDVMANENETLPKRINREQDMIHYLVGCVNRGTISADEDALREKFKKCYSNRTPSVLGRVVNNAMIRLKDDGVTTTESPYILYPNDQSINEWIENHSTEKLGRKKKDMKVDPNLGTYVRWMPDGYFLKTWYEARKRFLDTGIKTTVILRVQNPDANTIDQVRKEQRLLLEQMSTTIGNVDDPCIWGGSLPQVRATENLKYLIK